MQFRLARSESSSSRNCHSWICPLPARPGPGEVKAPFQGTRSGAGCTPVSSTPCYVAPSHTQVSDAPHCIFPALETQKMVTRSCLLCSIPAQSCPARGGEEAPVHLDRGRNAQRSMQAAVGLDPGSPRPSHPNSYPTEDEYLLICFGVRFWPGSFICNPKKEVSWQYPDQYQHQYSLLPLLLETGLETQALPISRGTVPCKGVSMVS